MRHVRELNKSFNIMLMRFLNLIKGILRLGEPRLLVLFTFQQVQFNRKTFLDWGDFQKK